MECFISFDLYEVTGGSYSDSFNDGREFGRNVGDKAQETIVNLFNSLKDKVSSIFSSSGGYNSSGNYGGTSQDGRSHSSAGMYLN